MTVSDVLDFRTLLFLSRLDFNTRELIVRDAKNIRGRRRTEGWGHGRGVKYGERYAPLYQK